MLRFFTRSASARATERAFNGFNPGPVNAVLHVPVHKVPSRPLTVADKILGDDWDAIHDSYAPTPGTNWGGARASDPAVAEWREEVAERIERANRTSW
jgi:hypothetical protein